MSKHKHPDHSEDIKRLNRIAGQIEGIKKMIDEKRYCTDILAQLRAVQSATKSVESNILSRHLKACVSDALSGSNEANSEAKINETIKISLLFAMYLLCKQIRK